MSTEILPKAPNAAHTPGPWVLTRAGSAIHDILVSSDAGYIADLKLRHNHSGFEERRQSDAHLIAAAPDLLSVAENAINAIEVYLEIEQMNLPRDYPMIEQLEINLALARETVARAKGDK